MPRLRDNRGNLGLTLAEEQLRLLGYHEAKAEKEEENGKTHAESENGYEPGDGEAL